MPAAGPGDPDPPDRWGCGCGGGEADDAGQAPPASPIAEPAASGDEPAASGDEPAASGDEPVAAAPGADPIGGVAPRLATRFPALFTPGAPKPLKLRIQADIQQRAPGEFTRKSLSAFLHRHTTGNAYLKALVAAQTRFDLDGAPAGEIAPEHREAAAAELARRRAIVQARRPAAGPVAGRARRPDPGAKPPGASPSEPRADRPREGVKGPDRDAQSTVPAHAPGRGPGRPARRTPPGRVKPIDTRPKASEARPAAAPADPAWPADDAQRERALLLRAWESSPLAKPNFCALKRLSEADFDAQIAQARAERDARR